MEALDEPGDAPLASWGSMSVPLARENSRFMLQGPSASTLQSFTSSAAGTSRGGPPRFHPPQTAPSEFTFRGVPEAGSSQASSSEASSVTDHWSTPQRRRPTFTVPSMFPFHGGPAPPERPTGPSGAELSLRDQYGLPGRLLGQKPGLSIPEAAV